MALMHFCKGSVVQVMCNGSERPLPDLGLRVEPSIARKRWDKVDLVIVEKVNDSSQNAKLGCGCNGQSQTSSPRADDTLK